MSVTECMLLVVVGVVDGRNEEEKGFDGHATGLGSNFISTSSEWRVGFRLVSEQQVAWIWW